MTLLITTSPRAEECAAAIQNGTGETTECADSLRRASKLLRSGEYAAIVIDQNLVEGDPDAADVTLQQAGTAIVLCVNLAISDSGRVVKQLKQALQRGQRERQAARSQAEMALRNELKDSLTALLLSCELALAVPQVPSEAQAKIRSASDLAKDLRSRLEVETISRSGRGNGGDRS